MIHKNAIYEWKISKYEIKQLLKSIDWQKNIILKWKWNDFENFITIYEKLKEYIKKYIGIDESVNRIYVFFFVQ